MLPGFVLFRFCLVTLGLGRNCLREAGSITSSGFSVNGWVSREPVVNVSAFKLVFSFAFQETKMESLPKIPFDQAASYLLISRWLLWLGPSSDFGLK